MKRAAACAGTLISERRAACELRLAGRMSNPADLPVLQGEADEIEQAETLRRKALAAMALHRMPAELESAALRQLRLHTEAEWWTDAFCAAGSVRGIIRLLHAQAQRHLHNVRSAPNPTGTREVRLVTDVRFFVDGENISLKHRCAQDILQRPDTHIVLFTSEQSQWPEKLDVLNGILGKNTTIECVDCQTGAKNAMDFQLVGVVGAYLAVNPDGVAYIVSNDTGYDAVIAMWISQGFSVMRIGSSELETASCGPAYKMKKDALAHLARRSLHWNGYQEDEKSRLADILVKFALDELPAPYAKDVHAAMGHYLGSGSRFTTIFAAERKNIEAFLESARAMP